LSARIAVTGTGLVCSLGRDRHAVLDALLAGKKGTRRLDRRGLDYGAEIPDFDAPRESGPSKNLKYMSRASALAVAAARRAIADASLPALEDDLGVFLGTGMTSSDLGELERLVESSKDERGEISLARVGERGLRATNPLISFKILSNMPLCHVALATRARGSNLVVHSLGGETLGALAEACSELREGRARAALFGGVDVQLERAGALQLARTGALAADGEARPFDRSARGRVLAEGAAFLVLEREDDARARGARPLATIESVGLALAPSVHLTPAPAASLRRAIERALDGRRPGAILSSAAGDPLGDEAEAVALAGIAAPVTALRGALGDSLAAGPAIDLALAAAILERGCLPSTHGLDEPREACRELDHVRETPRSWDKSSILVLGSSLSGTVGAALVGASS
jgi:3-oxoacyl-[acyl-carrier-protein] synthase II